MAGIERLPFHDNMFEIKISQMMRVMRVFKGCRAGLFIVGLAITTAALAEPPTVESHAAKPSTLIDPQLAIKQFQTPPGFKVDLFASEPQLLNPVAFSLDEQGRVFVAETYRYRKGVYDIRAHMNMYSADMACRTVEDRAAMIHKFVGNQLGVITNDSEQIRLLEDRDGDGKADHSNVFASGFNGVLDGLGAGILARKGKIYYTDIPNFWMLEDAKHTGHADKRTSIGYGFGVHFSLTGHDLHGLCLGPDGKIYFTIGDRGLHVKTREGKILDYPDMGTVLRCDLDGSELEVFATGVRNPQKLAFDDCGNLFSGDNNCDYGDAARLIYIVEGGDSGWRIGNQSSETTPAGEWNSEKLWHLQFPGQAAYIVPPIAHIAQGPAGFTHYPGTGFPASLKDHFFLCDYKSASPNSGIHSFAVQPKGAGFEMVDHTEFFWHILATDVNFSPDGRMFVSDWVAHWPVTSKGRLYRLYDPSLVKSPLVLETKKLIGEGMENRSLDELAALLGHADQRVRLEAQIEMTDRPGGPEAMLTVALKDNLQFARIHAIWGLGQAAQHHHQNLTAVLPLLDDKDAEIRAQTAKILGDAHVTAAADALIKSLTDPNLRVRFFAAQGLGKLGDKNAVEPLLAMLRENADKDPFLRHAGVMGLIGAAGPSGLIAAAHDQSPSVRLAIVVAMRRLQMPEITMFLQDSEPLVAQEAARAINDAPIPAAMPAMAALINHPTKDEMFNWRVINANFRVGTKENAQALADYAVRADVSENSRIEALHALATWPHPAERDRISGQYQPLPARNGQVAVTALTPVMATLLRDPPASVRAAAIDAAVKLNFTNASPLLFDLATNTNVSAIIRLAALKGLDGFHSSRLNEAVKIAMAGGDRIVRNECNRLLAKISPDEAADSLATVLASGTIAEQQGAFAVLGSFKGRGADKILREWLDKLIAGQVPKEIQFDLIEAASSRKAKPLKQKLQQYRAKQDKDDEFAGYRETLYGGDVAVGKKIFMERPTAGCFTCHKINGVGGNVGPDLAGVLGRHNREYILESILFPNKQIAPGFENVIVKTKDGQIYAGIVKSEDANELKISVTEDGAVTLLTVKKTDIQSRQRGLSGMPEGLGKALSKQDIRDLVAYVASLP